MKKFASRVLEAVLVEFLTVLIAIFIADRFSQVFFIVIGTMLAYSLAINPNISTKKNPNTIMGVLPQNTPRTPAVLDKEINPPASMWAAEPFVIFVQWLIALVLGNVLWNTILLPLFFENLLSQSLFGSLYDLCGAIITGFVIGTFQWSIINTNTFLPKRWIAFTVAGYVLVNFFYLISYSFPLPIGDYWFSNLIFFAFCGSIVGIFQSFVFGKIFSNSIIWILAITIGWSISGFAEYYWFDHLNTSSILLGGILSGLLEGFVSGIVIAYHIRAKISVYGK